MKASTINVSYGYSIEIQPWEKIEKMLEDKIRIARFQGTQKFLYETKLLSKKGIKGQEVHVIVSQVRKQLFTLTKNFSSSDAEING